MDTKRFTHVEGGVLYVPGYFPVPETLCSVLMIDIMLVNEHVSIAITRPFFSLVQCLRCGLFVNMPTVQQIASWDILSFPSLSLYTIKIPSHFFNQSIEHVYNKDVVI